MTDAGLLAPTVLAWEPPLGFMLLDDLGYEGWVGCEYKELHQANFLKVIGEFIAVLEGELPDSGPECQTCNYLVARNALD
jgi:aminoglycoside/choline kinase family phosphotransferase